MNEHNLNIIGLAKRKGDLIVGSKAIIEALQKKEKLMVFLASDAGDNTKKKIKDKTLHYNAVLDQTYSKASLEKAIGKKATSVVAIKHSKLLNALK